MVKQEQEIEFILFSLCAFEKSVDLVCNFIIIFIYVQKIYKSKESCKTSESGNDLVFFFRNEKSKQLKAKRLWEGEVKTLSCLV